MKKIVTVLSFTFFLGIHVSVAQDYPAAGQQWHSQHHLIKNGRATARSSKPDAARLRTEYRRVLKMEKHTRQQSWLGSKSNTRKYSKSEPVRIRSEKKNSHFLKHG